MPEPLYHDPAFASLYDARNGEGVRDRADFAFVRRFAGDADSVLDLGCGTGELAASLAAAGDAGAREVWGLDPAEAMLAVARARPGGDRVRWVRGDAAALALPRRFDLICMTGHAFQCLLAPKDRAAMLEGAARHLARGGRLVLDTRNPLRRAWEGWTPANTGHRPLPGVRAWVETREEGDLVRYDTVLVERGAERRATARLAFPPREEVEEAARRAGLAVRAVHGDWHGSPWTPQSPEIVLVAGRPAPS
ncbi:methyltransferase family protein [Hasllibacter halocynthiae]|uniref:Methyltransferase family protein n=1 Tax=Hasllibacter halocynthiae TaxID=595589 RepID=A0A2T0X7J9_9RHOB|nr:class I SAM-dependent methyltransferase [Hasllibacter halocynthiae]PRY94909.1 methyltransferase family protein [Hasllibacter halocynthiae]